MLMHVLINLHKMCNKLLTINFILTLEEEKDYNDTQVAHFVVICKYFRKKVIKNGL